MDEKTQPLQFILTDSNITTANGQHLYYIKHARWPSSRPDVALHAGRDKHSPTVAVCELGRFSGDKIALGDPSRTAVSWVSFEKTSVFHFEYHWSFGQQTFAWKRTHNQGVGGHRPRAFSTYNYKLVELHTNRVVAVYTNAKRTSLHSGTFEINVNYGKDFDTLVFLTCCALLEKQRRSNSSANASGAAGGSTGGVAAAGAGC